MTEQDLQAIKVALDIYTPEEKDRLYNELLHSITPTTSSFRKTMTAVEASALANQYQTADPERAKDILRVLRANGWKRLAEVCEMAGRS